MPKNIKHITKIILTFALALSLKANAQEVRVINNKGTIQTINNNLVTTNTSAPSNPVEGDIWFDSANNIVKIWDGAWLDLVDTSNLSSNIYNTSSMLTSNRNVDGNGSSLSFTNINGFTVNSSNSNSYTSAGANTFTASGANTFTAGGANTLTSTGATVINAGGGIQINNNTQITANLSVTGTFADTSTDVGTNGQILSSTATGTNWIDNTKNSVSTSDTAPVNPIENDIWFHTTTSPTKDHTLTKIYDGGNWIELVPKSAKVFYPPSIAIDASTPGNYTLDLYNDVYRAQFDSPLVRSDLLGPNEAPASIPTYAANELYYYVTDADLDVFGNGITLTNMSIDENGELSYTIVTPPADDNTIINVVFVVK